METGIRESIERFVRAGDEQSKEMLFSVTHPEFRIIAPNFPVPGNTTVLAREQFAALLEKKQMGGESRKIDFVNWEKVGESAAIVRARLTGQTLVFENAFSMVKSPEGWKIVQDMAEAKLI
ncbi:MAG: nuclear transport factor 2 family protein [Spirochaetia bacterium]|nr:nuclear transport factor 2 family protein [Spirochaetia bacterium]